MKRVRKVPITSSWPSGVSSAVITDGRFSVLVDASSGTPSLAQRIRDRTSAQALYFQVDVDSVPVMPRFRASGGAFALSAVSADRLGANAVSTTTPTDGQLLT